MADNGRQERLAEIAGHFDGSRAAGPTGYQDGLRPAAPPPLSAENVYGLAYLYARSAPDVWPTPITAPHATATAGPAFGREPAADRAEAYRPESAAMGAWEGFRDPGAVPHPHAAADVGTDVEVGWDSVGTVVVGLLGTLGVMTMFAFLKRHKVAATLWGLALIAWVLPSPY